MADPQLGASATSCCADTQRHHLGLKGTDRALPWRGSTGAGPEGEPGLSAHHHSISRAGALAKLRDISAAAVVV